MKALALLIALAACGSKAAPAPAAPPQNAAPAPAAPPPAPPPSEVPATIDGMMAKFGEFKDQMCACKDKACADTVMDGMNRWSEKASKESEAMKQKPTDEQMKRMQDVGMAFAECMQKAMTDAPPPTP